MESNNEELVLRAIKNSERSGIYEKQLFDDLKIVSISKPTIKRIIRKLYHSNIISKKRFKQQIKLYANPDIPRGKPYPIINKYIHQSFTLNKKCHLLNQIIEYQNLTPISQPFPIATYLDRCICPKTSKPKITIDDSEVGYKMLDFARQEIRFKINKEIPAHHLPVRSDAIQFIPNYYHIINIVRPTHSITIKINYDDKSPPPDYPLCQEWENELEGEEKMIQKFKFERMAEKNHFQLEIKNPMYPLAYYKILFFPEPKTRNS